MAALSTQARQAGSTAVVLEQLIRYAEEQGGSLTTAQLQEMRDSFREMERNLTEAMNAEDEARRAAKEGS